MPVATLFQLWQIKYLRLFADVSWMVTPAWVETRCFHIKVKKHCLSSHHVFEFHLLTYLVLNIWRSVCITSACICILKESIIYYNAHLTKIYPRLPTWTSSCFNSYHVPGALISVSLMDLSPLLSPISRSYLLCTLQKTSPLMLSLVSLNISYSCATSRCFWNIQCSLLGIQPCIYTYWQGSPKLWTVCWNLSWTIIYLRTDTFQ